MTAVVTLTPEGGATYGDQVVSAQGVLTIHCRSRVPTREALEGAVWEALTALRDRWQHG